MPMVRAMRLLNAIEAGTTTGTQLQTLLTSDPGRLAELNVLLGMRGQARRVAASSTAMAAVVASSTAMAAVTASSTAMTAVAASSTAMAAVAASSTAMAAVIASSTALAAVTASSTAMTAVAASSTAMAAVWAANTAADAVLTSATARAAVYESNIALAQLQFTPIQVARQIGISGRTVTASTSTSSHTFVANGTRVILLRRWYGNTEHDYINWARGTTATDATGGVVAPTGGRTLYAGVNARGTVSGTYNDNGVVPTTNDDTANFVAAANGLRRNTWGVGQPLHVTYILV